MTAWFCIGSPPLKYRPRGHSNQTEGPSGHPTHTLPLPLGHFPVLHVTRGPLPAKRWSLPYQHDLPVLVQVWGMSWELFISHHHQNAGQGGAVLCLYTACKVYRERRWTQGCTSDLKVMARSPRRFKEREFVLWCDDWIQTKGLRMNPGVLNDIKGIIMWPHPFPEQD